MTVKAVQVYFCVLFATDIFLNGPRKVTFALNVSRSIKAGLMQDQLKCVDGVTKS